VNKRGVTQLKSDCIWMGMGRLFDYWTHQIWTGDAGASGRHSHAGAWERESLCFI